MDAAVDATAGQFELNEDQRAIQEMARAFAADRVAPNALDWDRNQAFPRRRDPRDRPARLRRHLCRATMSAARRLAGSTPC